MIFFGLFIVALAVADIPNLPANYQSLPPDSKRDLIWSQIITSAYDVSGLPTNETRPPETLNLLNATYVQATFLYVSDELPAGRKKLMNALGTAAKVRLEIFANSSYSALFRSGGIGLARLSQRIRDPNHVTPHMALKFFINGKPSENMFVAYTLYGQLSDQNFFRHNLSNTFEACTDQPSLMALGKSFANGLQLLPGGYLDHPGGVLNMPLVQAAAVTTNGEDVDPILAPYQIAFVPVPNFKWNAKDTEDYRAKIARMIQPDMTLHKVYARPTPNETVWTEIGRLVAESWFVASKYGDETLFFQHPTRQWTNSTVTAM